MAAPKFFAPKFLFLLFLPLLNITEASISGRLNPLSAKASLLRYWDLRIPHCPKPPFLLEKASPLDALHWSLFRRYAERESLHSHLPAFCDAAGLFYPSEVADALDSRHPNADFTSYSGRNFTNYRSGATGGGDSFKKYSENLNVAIDSFKRYGRSSIRRPDSFSSYSPDVNVGDSEFSSYGVGASGGSGQFVSYADNINVPNVKFTAYESQATGRSREFKSYSDEGNAGDESFVSYGRKGVGIPSGFENYGREGNVIGSTFTNYGEAASRANDSFFNYGFNGNSPKNTFQSYAEGSDGSADAFTSYRDSANVGDDQFISYGKRGISPQVSFTNYGHSVNVGTDKFKGYGEGAKHPHVGFKTYGINTTFGDYGDKKSATFASYAVAAGAASNSSLMKSKWVVEPGKFFKEKMLKSGSLIPMPDIRDRMPPRSFLPRSIVEKFPFSSSKLGNLKTVFRARDNSTMEKMMKTTLAECEREASRGETKRCVTSIEDMIDFATSVLGTEVQLRTTDSVQGWGKNVVIGGINGIDGGRVTRSVSCHQSWFPYLVYYCHSIPSVRVYEADLLDVQSRRKINHGVAICHLDTSSWGATHGAFIALNSKPGETEVCHWIFQNDMIWVRSSPLLE